MSTVNLQQRQQDLLNHIRQGKIFEALNEFYDTDTVMQDNANPPTKGLTANIEREKQFMPWKSSNTFTISLVNRAPTAPSMSRWS